MIHHTYQLHFLGMTLGDRQETFPQATMSVCLSPLFISIYLTFIFFRGLLYHVAGLLRPDRLVDLMIAMFQNVLNCPIGIPSILPTGRIIIDLAPLVGLVARRALIIMNLQHAIQTQTTGSARLRGGARLLWRNS
jgi:hypothetical protein